MSTMEPVRTDALAAGTALDSEVPIHQWSQWGLVWRRFKRHRLAVIGARVLLFMIVLAVIGQVFSLPAAGLKYGSPMNANLAPRLWPFDWFHLLGTDQFGRPVFSTVLGGAAATLEIGIFGSFLAALIGTVLGGFSGYVGGWVDAVLMRLVDAFLTIPFLPLLLMLSLYLQDNRGVLIYAVLFGLTGWSGVARLVRSYVLSLREREFADAARALGASEPGIIMRHMLPNTLDVLIVSFTLNVAVFIVTEASLDFLGAGPAADTWGYALAHAYASGAVLSGYWWTFLFPGMALLVSVLAVNFLGDGLRDALDSSGHDTLVRSTSGTEELSRFERVVLGTVRGLALGIGGLRQGIARPVGGARLLLRISSADDASGAVPVRPSRLASIPWVENPPPALQVVPIVLVFLLSGIAFLYGHSPLKYAPHFAAPTQYGTTIQSDYSAVPRSTGGWDIFDVDGSERLVFTRTGSSGRPVQVQQVAPRGDTPSAPSFAERDGHALGAWIASDGSVVQAARLGAPGLTPFPLNPAGGSVEHPYVVRVKGGFAILFGWTPANSNAAFDIYDAFVPDGASRPAALRRIGVSPEHGYYSRGAADGSGALDVMWSSRVKAGEWNWIFGRFTPQGIPLGRSIVLDTVHFCRPLASGACDGNVVPQSWAIDMKTAPDGSVWSAWQHDTIILVAHWNRVGTMILPPTVVVPFGIDDSYNAVRSVALAVTASGGQIYHNYAADPRGYIGLTSFDRRGVPVQTQPERVAYDAGGEAYTPKAGTVHGRVAVLWTRTHSGTSDLVGTVYHPKASTPSLLTRLGLNIGNVWADILLVVFGSLAGGIGLTVVNLFVIVPMILVWLPIGRLLPRAIRWPSYLLTLALVLAGLFALRAHLPGFLLVFRDMGSLYGWYAVIGAAFVAFWSGELIVRRQDALIRASSMAIIAFYFIATMDVIIWIQDEIGHI